MTAARRRAISPVIWPIALAWALSWVFARDLVKGLEAVGVLPRRGIVFSDASDFALSLVVLAGLLFVWAVVRGAKALALRGVRAAAGGGPDDDVQYDELLRQKDALLRELKDLELDRHMRKLDDTDYAAIEAKLRREATAVLRALDALNPVRAYDARIRSDLEALLARRAERINSEPAAGSPPVAPPLDDDDRRWRDEVLARPGYGELVTLLGERDVLLAALAGYTIESAEIDRSSVGRSKLAVTLRGDGQPLDCTLDVLRERVASSLGSADARSVARAARLQGVRGTP